MIGKGDQRGRGQLDGSGDTGQLEDKRQMEQRQRIGKGTMIIRRKIDTGQLEVG